VLNKGTQPASVARPRVEPILKSKKKAAQARKLLGNITTLEAAAAALQDSIKTVDSVTMDIRNRFGFDANAVGAIFNPANKGKLVTEPIEGASKLYVLRVDDVYTTAVINADIERKKSDLRANGKSMHGIYSMPAMLMRKQANIKDNRKNFY
jgi:peptidyl-prolyl cis-trans isomerase D